MDKTAEPNLLQMFATLMDTFRGLGKSESDAMMMACQAFSGKEAQLRTLIGEASKNIQPQSEVLFKPKPLPAPKPKAVQPTVHQVEEKKADPAAATFAQVVATGASIPDDGTGWVPVASKKDRGTKVAAVQSEVKRDFHFEETKRFTDGHGHEVLQMKIVYDDGRVFERQDSVHPYTDFLIAVAMFLGGKAPKKIKYSISVEKAIDDNGVAFDQPYGWYTPRPIFLRDGGIVYLYVPMSKDKTLKTEEMYIAYTSSIGWFVVHRTTDQRGCVYEPASVRDLIKFRADHRGLQYVNHKDYSDEVPEVDLSRPDWADQEEA
jgi:hypothetical protein